MSAWKPGAVVRVGGMLAFYTDGNEGPMFTFADGSRARADVVPADPARPLVVIDPEDAEQVERLVTLYCNQFPISRGPEDDEAMADALREFANPTPPKPEEPQGLGAVVRDAGGRVFVAAARDLLGRRLWVTDESAPARRFYREIDAVEVLSEGVIA